MTALLVPSVLGVAQSHAWYVHTLLGKPLLETLSPEIQEKIKQRKISCLTHNRCDAKDVAREYAFLAKDLGLNPATIPPAFTPFDGSELDEPDMGFDQNLPDEFDPKGDRLTMGGKEGPTSQGFRHMYFGGMDLFHPITSFQVPFHAVGQAPERVEKIALEARKRIRAGDVLWGSRLLFWALHYIQDLSQPFHAVQIPSLAMLPFETFFSSLSFPPRDVFPILVRETTRTIANYHWAFEGYVKARLEESDKTNPFVECLKAKSPQFEKVTVVEPKTLALQVAAASVKLGPHLGQALTEFLGHEYKNPEIDLAHDKGVVQVQDLKTRPDLTQARIRLHEVTCAALANGMSASRALVEWAFHP